MQQRQQFQQQSEQLNQQQETQQQPQPNPNTLWQQQAMARETQYQQQLTSERERSKQLEEYVWQQTVNQYPPDQRPILDWARQNNQYLQQLQAENEQSKRYREQMEAAILPMVKDKVFSQLSQQSNLPKEVLQYAETPQDAMRIIQALTEYKKKESFQQRAANGNDNVATTSGQAGATTQAPELSKFRNSGNIRGYIAAKKAAGLW